MNRQVTNRQSADQDNASIRKANAGLLARSLSIAACLLGGTAVGLALMSTASAQDGVSIPVPDATPPEGAAPIVSVTVNSSDDGIVTADQSLTLREAIEITNGTLPLSALSQAESALVTPFSRSEIRFALTDGTDIELLEVLPPLMADGLMLDGTSQTGYGATSDEPAAVPVPIPAISLRPAAEAEVFRGLTVSADDVTVRGLSIHGFSARHRSTASTPPADILITHVAPPQGNNAGYRGPRSASANTLRLTASEEDQAPNGVIIEDNWLGVPPSGIIPEPAAMSAFGVSVFNGTDTVIQRNRIGFHESSGIITSSLAKGLMVTENTLIGNGLAGLPSAIYMAGNIDGAQVFGNLMCANDGSGVAMFKPEGSARIYGNDIRFNGRRFRSAGVSLMGSGR